MDSTLAQLKSGQLQGSTQLKLSCGLTEFPRAIFDLAETLEILDLSGNQLSSLPDDLDRLSKLRILFCSSNQFSTIPAVLGKCPNLSMIGFKANQITHIPEEAIPIENLRWFIVTDNALTKVPETLGRCRKLQKLMLAGNQLRSLPASMVHCEALELLRISANQFTYLPNWLFDLPKLTWLAYAGNPFSNAIEAAHLQQQRLLRIDWSQLVVEGMLGQGASGVTYQAKWQHDDNHEAVAIKLFTAGLTSDGLPSCEMQANLIAGEHQNLVGVKGIITNHPTGAQGLVMPLLNANLTTLAAPPNFDTCSRDVYPIGLSLSTAQVKHISKGVANAMFHLHAQGLIHGDLYAHNILWNDEQVILSDLGGASFLPIQDYALRAALKKLDVRAYYVLMQELANLTNSTDNEVNQINCA